MIVINRDTGKIENRPVKVKKAVDVDAFADSVAQRLKGKLRQNLEIALRFLDTEPEKIDFSMHLIRYQKDTEGEDRFERTVELWGVSEPPPLKQHWQIEGTLRMRSEYVDVKDFL